MSISDAAKEHSNRKDVCSEVIAISERGHTYVDLGLPSGTK